MSHESVLAQFYEDLTRVTEERDRLQEELRVLRIEWVKLVVAQS